MNDAIDFSTLSWVKAELDVTLKEARQALEAYVEHPDDEARAGILATHLHQVYGTLQMVELHGAALLAGEMEQVALSLRTDGGGRRSEALDVLMRAILQLPDYLDRLVAGHRDIPLVLLPLLNDLRAVRGENLLSEGSMFSPDLDRPLPDSLVQQPAVGDLREHAREIRHRFQTGLLGLFRGRDTGEALAALSGALDSLIAISSRPSSVRLWWTAAGVVDALRSDALPDSVSVKRLLGQVDRCIRDLVEHGEDPRFSGACDELCRNLLFYVGQAQGGGERVAQICDTYDLHELLPGEEELAAARESLSGQNADLFRTVATAVKEELGRLKDSLDIVLRSGQTGSGELAAMVDSLQALSDTLGMLGLGAARQAVLDKASELRACVDSDTAPAETTLMDVASTLLFVESSVERLGQEGPAAAAQDQMAASEFDQVKQVVLNEAISDLTRAKEAIVSYAESRDHSDIAEVPQLLGQVKGGLLLLGETRAAALIASAARYIEQRLLEQQAEPDPHEMDSLADAICGIEYFLEGRREYRFYGQAAMDIAEQRVESLGFPAQDASGESAAVEDDGGSAASAEEAAAGEDRPPETVAADERPEDAEPEPGETPADVVDEAMRIADAGSVVDAEPPADTEPALDETGESLAEAQQSHDTGPDAVEDAADAVVGEEDEAFAQLAVVGEETDEEILEIFIEEAEEEIASIHENLPRWRNDLDDADALATMRRSWHTLKGSGRLIGAMRIGEFAWAFENMLNRVIDGTVAPQPPLLDLLQDAVDTLPELVAQIQHGTPVARPAGWLMRCADALSAGEPLPERAVAGAPADAAAPLPEEVAAGEEAAEETAAAVESPETAVQDTVAAPRAGDAAAIEDGFMDPELFEIFDSETRVHLSSIQAFLDGGAAAPTEDLVRALHTLHGSAHMAEADAIARIAGELEKYVKAAQASEQDIDADGRRALADGAALIEEMMESLPGEAAVADGLDALLGRVADLQEQAAVEALQQAAPAGETQQPTDEVENAGADEAAEVAGEAPVDPYADCDAELVEIFLEEGAGILERSDAAIQAWHESNDTAAAVEQLQRELHTLKGGARMAEINAIGDLAHAVESLLMAVSGQPAGGMADAVVQGVQEALDRLVDMLVQVRSRQPLEPADALLARLDALREQWLTSADEAAEEPEEPAPEAGVPAAGAEMPAVVTEAEPGEAPAGGGTVYDELDQELLEVFLEEAHDILENSENTLQAWKASPADRMLIADLQRELHTLKGGARMADIGEIGDLSHAMESLIVATADGSVQPSAEMFALLEQTHDRLATMVSRVRERQPLAVDAALLDALRGLKEGGRAAESPAAVEEPVVERVGPAADTPHIERRAAPRAPKELVRVRADMLDNLVNYAGEVSIYRSRLEQQVGASRFNLVELEQTVTRLREQLRKLEIETEAQILFRYEKEIEESGDDFDPLEMDRYSNLQQLSRSLMESVGDIDSIQNLLDNIARESETLLLQQARVNTELQEGLMRTRMVPFIGLAPRMRRIVRQTCQQLGKKAELELSGAEGEMDRTVIDRVIAPIEHMLRNAISHGIETPEQRRAAGKPETGTIAISLTRESSEVVLKIRDDGAGIRLDAIRSKAIERGLLAADAEVSDNDILQYILETGFSTAEEVTQIAGRGVGMDVVNSEVKQLGGSLHIDSKEGQGTTFTIRLPFTLAVNQALLIEVGEDPYAIPLSSIQGIVRMRREDLQSYYDDPDARFEYGGFAYEVRHLGSLLGLSRPNLDSMARRIPVLLVRTGDYTVALQVENLMGSREIVVKSVGPQISTVRGVSGATILGDGSVVMILDVAALLRGGTATVLNEVEDMFRQPVQSSGTTVMVVDDSITVRKVTTRLLERNEMNVIAAKDGVDAVSKLQDHLPDVMLLDIEMPRMDGFELATHVRNDPRLRHIPIIMITSRTGDKHRQRALEIGVNRYLGKPFQEAELLSTIEEVMQDSLADA